MNIAKIMIPKVCTAFLREDNTIRQGLETMTYHGYTALPVLDPNQHYVGSITEGDFLRYMMEKGTTDKRALEQDHISDILRRDFCPALSMDSDDQTILSAILNQNFVPIVDSRNVLCGILTRRGVISHLAEKSEK
ncbi:MAG: CBS domain-containing protein [Lachnospiraceae bacterium]|nr:CBS domain-containing protein [Lachnospiraceae bacterium]